MISEDLGLKLENLQLNQLGKAKQVKVNKDSTTLIQGAGKKADIQKRIDQLRRQIEETESEYDKEKFQERLAKLSGGVALIHVGAATEADDEGDQGPRRGRPARHPRGGRGRDRPRRRRRPAPRHPGRPEAARRARPATRSSAPRSSCGRSRSRSATSPSTRATTAAWSPRRSSRASGSIGFNANTGEYVDMFEAGIVDPTKVTRSALQNAASIAALMLTTEAMITNIKDDEKESAPASRARSAERRRPIRGPEPTPRHRDPPSRSGRRTRKVSGRRSQFPIPTAELLAASFRSCHRRVGDLATVFDPDRGGWSTSRIGVVCYPGDVMMRMVDAIVRRP